MSTSHHLETQKYHWVCWQIWKYKRHWVSGLWVIVLISTNTLGHSIVMPLITWQCCRMCVEFNAECRKLFKRNSIVPSIEWWAMCCLNIHPSLHCYKKIRSTPRWACCFSYERNIDTPLIEGKRNSSPSRIEICIFLLPKILWRTYFSV